MFQTQWRQQDMYLSTSICADVGLTRHDPAPPAQSASEVQAENVLFPKAHILGIPKFWTMLDVCHLGGNTVVSCLQSSVLHWKSCLGFALAEQPPARVQQVPSPAKDAGMTKRKSANEETNLGSGIIERGAD